MSNLALETVLFFSGCVTVQVLEQLCPRGGATVPLCVYVPLADGEPFRHLLGTEYIG